MIKISAYLKNFVSVFPELEKELPWDVITSIQNTVQQKIKTLPSDYKIHNDVAIHKTARIEENVTMKGPMIISSDCFVGAHAYLRGGVFLGEKAVVGPGCEVKSSVILSGSALAHFNFVGEAFDLFEVQV